MPDFSSDLDFYNSFFDSVPLLKKTKVFCFNEESRNYEGAIRVSSKGEGADFEVHIPEAYPLKETRFYARSFSGYPHQNLDGSLCLNTSFVNHTYTRLHLEVEKLKGYVKKYYEEEQADEHYEYIPVPSPRPVNMLFQESFFNEIRFAKKYGHFEFSVLNYDQDEKGVVSYSTIYAQTLAGRNNDWSSYYRDRQKYTGLWLLLDTEPVHARKSRITEWQDLFPLLPQEFAHFFHDLCARSSNNKLGLKWTQGNVVVALGYKIPTQDGFEVHWDLILLPRADFPKNVRKLQPLGFYNQKIKWGASSNAAYDRFFGRGRCADRLLESRILIIGNGAVGSTLAHILVRGGARRLAISDNEEIEAGNICRSAYRFINVSFSKTRELKKSLEDVSPYAEVEILGSLGPEAQWSRNYEELKNTLTEFNFIFDCTANNEMLQMLSDMGLKSDVFHISMTNKAGHMICISNNGGQNMMERRNQMLFSFGQFREAQFREGTGCWHPTFEAAFFDVNQLLNTVFRKLNSYFRLKRKPGSFYVSAEPDGVRISEDIDYLQPELGLRLTIESKCLEKIEELSRKHYPGEFGGVLVGGYINDFRGLVISDVIVPEKYRNGPSSFTPDPADLNRKLKDLYTVYDGKLDYLGDWHSHPNGNNQYSSVDFDSIRKVALSDKVNTHNPILLIAAYSHSYFDPGFYVYSKNRLYKFRLIDQKG